MPFLAPFVPAIVGGVSAAASAFGQSGKQGGAKQTQQQNQTQAQISKDDTSFQQGSTTTAGKTGFRRPEEDEDFSQFRTSLLPFFQNQLQRVNEPVFGEAQKAGFLSQLNELGASSAENLKQGLARSGASDSGRMSQGLTDIELGRNAQASQFFSQLPFMEQQAKQQRFGNLMGLATNFAGRAPIGEAYGESGTTQQEAAGEGHDYRDTQGTTTGTGTATSEQEGGSFLKNFLKNIGGIGGFAAGGMFSGAGKAKPVKIPSSAYGIE